MAATVATSKLFQPLQVGTAKLSHRIAMAPLTRFRVGENHVVLDSVAQYYADRASTSGTLLISEATSISNSESGVPNAPGFSSEAEIAGWKKVYEAVHSKGGYIFQQIWGMGRAADPEYLKEEGFKYASSSNIQLKDKPLAPEPLTEEEILEKINDFAQAAKRVIDAGADGVEIHGAHGYLIDQFTRDSVNNRTDRWGGSVENRARFVLEIVKATVAAVGAEHVGLRLSPFTDYNDAVSTDLWTQFKYIIGELKKANYKLAYLSLVERKGESDPLSGKSNEQLDFILEKWDNQSPVILAGGYTPELAPMAVDERYSKYNVVIAFGRHFIANPDLVFRIKNHIKLNKYNRATFYTPKAVEGYNDYPFSSEFLQSTTAIAA
jgi:NADPH2 dehydrogenase